MSDARALRAIETLSLFVCLIVFIQICYMAVKPNTHKEKKQHAITHRRIQDCLLGGAHGRGRHPDQRAPLFDTKSYQVGAK